MSIALGEVKKSLTFVKLFEEGSRPWLGPEEEDIDEEDILESTGGPVWAAGQHHGLSRENARGDALEVKKNKTKRCRRGRKFLLLCIRDLNSQIDSCGQAMSQSETNSLSSKSCLN